MSSRRMPPVDDYSLLLSRAFSEVGGHFAALASPTLSKQETITFLYERVLRGREAPDRPRFGHAVALRIEFVARLLVKFIAVLAASVRFRVRSIPRNVVFLRTWLVPKSFVTGAIVDDYFRRLVDDLRVAEPIVVAFHPMAVRDYFRGFRGANKAPDFVISVGFLSVRDVLRLFTEYVLSARVRLSRDFEFRGRDVTSLISQSLDLDYFKLRSFQAYIDRYVAEKVKLYAPSAFIYIFENQAWEKAWLSVFDKTTTKCIGYQSSGFSDRFLNFFPSAADRDQQRFPAVILTVGDLFGETLRTRGDYPVPIVTFAATRFDYPVSQGRYEVSRPRSDLLGRILYAFAVHEYQYRGIIRDLADSFEDSGIEVVLKFHPLHVNKYRSLSLPGNFRIWQTEPGRALRDAYDAVLFNDNSYGFEALMQGVRAYEYKCEPVYDETRLWGFDLYDCVLDRSRLNALRDSMLDCTFDKSYPVDRAAAYLNHAFRPYTAAAFREFQQILVAPAISSDAIGPVRGASLR